MKRPVVKEMRDIGDELRRTTLRAACLQERYTSMSECVAAIMLEYEDEIREVWGGLVDEVGVRQARRRCPRVAEKMRGAGWGKLSSRAATSGLG
jgi:hypothetical protein